MLASQTQGDRSSCHFSQGFYQKHLSEAQSFTGLSSETASEQTKDIEL